MGERSWPFGPERDIRIGIAAAAKCEAPYLLEWIAFHRTVGIRTFFIADNGGDDGTSDLLERLHQAKIITRFDFIGRPVIQNTCYTEMVPRMRGVVDLAAIIDCDEFIRPLEGQRADSLLASFFANPQVSALALNWAIYGSSGHISDEPGLVTERFTQRSERTFAENAHVKSVVRVDRFRSCDHPHYSNLSRGRFIDTTGGDVVWGPNQIPGISAKCAWKKVRLDHFVVKSREEYETIKRNRGRSDLPPDHPHYIRDAGFFPNYDRNDVFDPMPSSLVENTKVEISSMRSRLKL